MLKAICLGRVKYDINLLVENMPAEEQPKNFSKKLVVEVVLPLMSQLV